MRAVVFVGPTLAADPILRRPGPCEWLPPAANGDLYRAAKTKPAAIGLIDGCFETTPAVWHKEILWALSQGIHVFGAASMGALRAAELKDFGMGGIGQIYRDYANGALTDDDEVAVLHAPRELGFQPLTEAMVDIRATLHAARKMRIISPRTATRLETAAKATFFKDRTWERTLKEETGARASKPEITRLRQWLTRNRVEVKRRDARALVRAIQRLLARKPCPHQPLFVFSHTTYWQALASRVRAEV